MHKVRITSFSPIHISSGLNHETGYNLLHHQNRLYLMDEFRAGEWLLEQGGRIDVSYEQLRKSFTEQTQALVDAEIPYRSIPCGFSKVSSLLSHISTQRHPIIPGSSIKGAMRTAYLAWMGREKKSFKDFRDDLEDLDDHKPVVNTLIKKYNVKSFKKSPPNEKDVKKTILKKANSFCTQQTKTLFQHLKLSDTLTPLPSETWQAINMKKLEEHQENRSDHKIEQCMQHVEAIPVNTKAEITLEITHAELKSIGEMCNAYYTKAFKLDSQLYFCQRNFKAIIAKGFLDSLSNTRFLINVGRYGGAESKSISQIRSFPRTGSGDDLETTARTFGVKTHCDVKNSDRLCEGKLWPFGWVLCEVME